MDHLSAAGTHKERRLFDHVMADIDDQVGLMNGAVDEVAIGQRGVTDKVRAVLINHALAHLLGHHRDAELVDKGMNHFGGELAVGGGAKQQQRLACGADRLHGLANGFFFRHRSAMAARLQHRRW